MYLWVFSSVEFVFQQSTLDLKPKWVHQCSVLQSQIQPLMKLVKLLDLTLFVKTLLIHHRYHFDFQWQPILHLRLALMVLQISACLQERQWWKGPGVQFLKDDTKTVLSTNFCQIVCQNLTRLCIQV